MKIAVIGANGKSGSAIVKEAVERGIEVTAVMRRKHSTPAQHVLIKDLLDLTTSDLADYDAVIDCFGTWSKETIPFHKTSLQKLSDLLSNTKTRLFVVGAVSSLYTDSEHKHQFREDSAFPKEIHYLAQVVWESLVDLQKRDDVLWTYVSPAINFQADGKKTGQYIIAGNELQFNDNGESYISYADYAVAIIDEIMTPKHVKEWISVYHA